MALIGEMQYLTIGGNTYSLPVGGGGTVTSVAVSNATNGGLSISGSPISSSGTITIGHSNVLTAAQTTQAVYPIKIDKNGHISEYGSAVTIPSITLNGSSSTSPSFYAPTDAGTNGYVLKSNGSGAPSWASAVLTDEKLAVTDIKNNSNPIDCYPILGNGTTAQTRYYDSYGLQYSVTQGSTSVVGEATLVLGNWIASGTNYNKKGILKIYGTDSNYTSIISSTNGTNRTITLPNATGTIALTSDIPTVPTKVSDLTNDSGFITLTDVPEEVFVVTITYSNNEYFFNKTYAQIIAAYNAGKHIVGHDISFNNYYYIKSVYEHSTEGQITFSNFIDVDEPFSSESKGYIVCNVIYMDSSNNITSYTCQLAVPTRTSHLTNNSGFITLNDVPTIPTVNDATLTIQKNGTTVNTFTANASSNVTANISVPTDTGDLTNGAGFITSSSLPTVNDATLTIQKNGTAVGTFTANASSNVTANITMPNIFISTSDPTSADGNNGDVWFKYEEPEVVEE